jgi:hypothetical protein
MSREKVLRTARLAGCEDMAKRLLDQGLGEDYIVDRIFEEAGKGGFRRTVSLDEIDDETFARALTEPQMIEL